METIITKYGYIYKITNKINNKIYIGKRVGSSFDERYWGSGTKLRSAIKEFGIENFTREIIEWCSTKDILRDRERYWILKLDARNPSIGYNKRKGGEGVGKVHPEAMCRNGSIIISIQVPDFAYEWLKQKAKEECTSVSYLIRRLVLEDIREREQEEK